MKVDEVINNTLKGVREMLDVDMVIGKPITTDDVIVIPITKLSLGFVNATAELEPKISKLMEGMPLATVGGGATINPIGFLIISQDKVKFLPIDGGEIDKWSSLINIAKDLFLR